MKTALRAVAIGLLFTSVLAGSAKAGYVVTLTQQGSNVVATGSGPIDLTGLSFFQTAVSGTGIIPSDAAIVTGPPSGALENLYTGFTGPTSFGSGGTTSPPNSGSGNIVGIAGNAALHGLPLLGVPSGYVSDSPLSDTATYDSQTFSSLGVTPGTFEWTWGMGANQNFTLEIGVAAVPEASTWAMMALGFAGLGFLGYRKTRSDNALA